MSREQYAAVSGASAAWRRMDTVAQNLANSSTVGFRGQRVAFELTDPAAGLVDVSATVADRRSGAIHSTGNATDVALRSPGWFAVEGASGAMLTRAGDFQVRADGRLVTAGGASVLGQSGPIDLPIGESFAIEADGRIVAERSGEIDRIRVVDATAEPAGGNLWRPTGPLTEVTPDLVQGALEGSNVDPLAMMVELVEAGRAFEIFQQAIRGSDELDGRLHEFGGR